MYRPQGFFSENEGSIYLDIVKHYPGGVIVELGTHLGLSLSYILDFCKETKAKLYAIDLWVPDWGGEHDRWNRFNENLVKLGGADYVNVLRMNSVEAAKNFKDNEVDVVFIDTVHSVEHTRAEINAWWSKLKIGGVLVGHDYDAQHYGVIQAIDEAFGKPDKILETIWIINKNEVGRKIT